MESATTTQIKKTTVKKVSKATKKPEDVPIIEMNTPVSEQITEDNITTTVSDLEINTVLEFINSASDKFSDITKFVKDNQSQFSKDERMKLEASFKKLFKAHTSAHIAFDDMMSKQVSIYEKTSNGKVNTVKKIVDKEKAAIHKPQVAHPFLLAFMKKENDTLVSRSEVLTAITNYVKANPEIVSKEDKRYFNLSGDLGPLFQGIKGIMINKNLINDSEMPDKIMYTQIMKYMTHCFVNNKDTKVV